MQKNLNEELLDNNPIWGCDIKIVVSDFLSA